MVSLASRVCVQKKEVWSFTVYQRLHIFFGGGNSQRNSFNFKQSWSAQFPFVSFATQSAPAPPVAEGFGDPLFQFAYPSKISSPSPPRPPPATHVNTPSVRRSVSPIHNCLSNFSRMNWLISRVFDSAKDPPFEAQMLWESSHVEGWEKSWNWRPFGPGKGEEVGYTSW